MERRQFGFWHASIGAWLSGRVLILTTLAVVAFLVGTPLFWLVRSSVTTFSLQPGEGVGFTLDYFRNALQGSGRLHQFAVTLIYAFGSALLTTLLAATLAWLVERTDVRGKTMAHLLCYVLFAIPGVLKITGWTILLNGRNGFLWELIRHLTGLEVRFPLYSVFGMIWVQSFILLPTVFLFLSTSFSNLDPSLEEAAFASGVGLRQVIPTITLRLAAPGLGAGFLLALIDSMVFLDTPLFIGMPSSIYTVVSQIFRDIHMAIIPDYGTASAMAILLMVPVVLALYGYQRLLHSGGSYQTITGKGFRPRRISLGKYRWAGQGLVVALLLLIVSPVLCLIWVSFFIRLIQPVELAGSLDLLTLQNYSEALRNPGILGAVRNSLAIGVASATGVVLLAVAVSWLLERVKSPGAWLLDHMATFPLAFSGVLMGLGVLIAYLNMPIPVYGTIWLLVLAFVPLFLPYGVRYVHAGLVNISTELEESGRACGVGAGGVLLRITAPLLRSALLSAWIFTFLITVRELGAALLLTGPHSPVIASVLFDLANEGSIGVLSAFGLMVAGLSGAVALLTRMLAERFGYEG